MVILNSGSVYEGFVEGNNGGGEVGRAEHEVEVVDGVGGGGKGRRQGAGRGA